MDCVHALDMLHAASAITKTTGLTNAIAKEVELGTTGIATTNNLVLRNQWRVDRPCLFNTDIAHHSTNGDVLINPTPLARNQCALIDLNAFFIAFDDTNMNIDRVADIKARDIRFERFSVD